VANFIESEEEQVSEEVVQETEVQQEPQDEGTQEAEFEVDTPEQEEEEEELPSKYKGKSVKDIIRMHQEAEKLIGRQAQEVGEVRKLADELIKRQLDTKVEAKAAPEEEEIDFYENPEQAVKKAVEKHPAIAEARQQALQLKQMQFAQKLQENFPSFQETVQDPSFAEWVKSSPVRLRLYAEADGNLDYDSAAELLGTWGYIKGQKQATKQAVTTEIAKQQRDKSIKAATVSTGSVGVESKKTYRSSDIQNLIMRDPARYEAMQEELMLAYREGRVKP